MIPINDLKRHNQSIFEEIKHAILRVMESGWYVLGPEVEAFETEFADYCGVNYCVGVGNGTDALELALRALDVKAGEQVALVANAGMYGTTAVNLVGANPLYIDVDPVTMTMDINVLASTVTVRTQAIIVTHLYGQMADMPGLLKVAEKFGIPVIEDCAQSHGASVDGKRAGSWGDIGCFSFYPTKNLGALGDGGAITTSNPDLAERVRVLRQYGWVSKYQSDLTNGRNSRLDEMQAAILRVKLPYLENWNERRREIAGIYTDGLQNLELALPTQFGDDYIAHLYVIRTAQRDQLRAGLLKKGVATDIHYPIPDYQQQSMQRIVSSYRKLPVTENCCQSVLTLPCFPEMSNDDIVRVIDAVYNTFA